MAPLTIELPEELTAEINDRHIPAEVVHQIAVLAIKAWLHREKGSLSIPGQANGISSPFSESAIPFIDRLIDENRALFDRLARLPDRD
jgi:hypothetical protein